MQSSGSTEGLRGLIDTSLLKSIKKIIQHRELFGPGVLPLGEWERPLLTGIFSVCSDQHHGYFCAQ